MRYSGCRWVAECRPVNQLRRPDIGVGTAAESLAKTRIRVMDDKDEALPRAVR
jgi:hypothetical protein